MCNNRELTVQDMYYVVYDIRNLKINLKWRGLELSFSKEYLPKNGSTLSHRFALSPLTFPYFYAISSTLINKLSCTAKFSSFALSLVCKVVFRVMLILRWSSVAFLNSAFGRNGKTIFPKSAKTTACTHLKSDGSVMEWANHLRFDHFWDACTLLFSQFWKNWFCHFCQKQNWEK